MTTPLRAIRLQQCLYERQAARRARVNPSLWCRYELGQLTPTRPTAERIAKALGVSVADLWPAGVKELGGVRLDG